ncbi:hypothetical protein [Nostoc sp.]|uniref:hypothetical protein n=1 Tax=Nostoc sp. TaxID=1180 RepID=UPI002FFA4CEE
MRIPRFAKVLVAFLAGVMLVQLLYACLPRLQAAEKTRLIGIENFTFILSDSALWTSIAITIILVVSVLAITIGLGTLLAVLFDQDFYGCKVARVLVISPFFVMPTVSALIWNKYADASGEWAVYSNHQQRSSKALISTLMIASLLSSSVPPVVENQLYSA